MESRYIWGQESLPLSSQLYYQRPLSSSSFKGREIVEGKPLSVVRATPYLTEVHWEPTHNHCSQVKLGRGDTDVFQKTQNNDINVKVTQLVWDLGLRLSDEVAASCLTASKSVQTPTGAVRKVTSRNQVWKPCDCANPSRCAPLLPCIGLKKENKQK